MFRAFKLLSVKQLVLNEKVLSLSPPSILNVFGAASTSRNYAAPRRRVESEIQFVKLQDIKQFKGLEKYTFTTKSSQDYICKFILQKNITVPNLIGRTRTTDIFQRSNLMQLPSIVSFGKFDAEEDKIIVENVENLVKHSKMKSFVEVLEIDPRDEHRFTRIEIIGSYLSQGLQKIRLPQEVFARTRKLLICPKGDFTETEKRIIDEHISGCENFKDWSSLAKKLGRDRAAVRNCALRFIREKEKIIRGGYTAEESKKVLDHVYAINNNALSEDFTIPSNVWHELSNCLNRPRYHVFMHWLARLQPLLTRYEAGVLEVDFKIPLLKYCISKDIMYSQNANWVEISKDPQFAGTTPSYLTNLYKSIRYKTKQSPSYKGRKDHEITTKVMLEYELTKKAVSKLSDKTKSKVWEKCVLDYYENYIKKSS